MILAFRVRPAASGRGLCDIDKVSSKFRVHELRAKRLGNTGRAKLSVYFRLAKTSQFFDT